MFDILRDPMWQFVAVILAILAILITYAIYRKQRRRKLLTYDIISRTPLLSNEEEVKGKLQILFEDQPVQQVHLIVMRISNSGDVPILATDYERPVTFSFGEESKILTVEVVETEPDSLHALARIEDDRVALEPTLLNQGDVITLKMLISKFGGEVAVDGRIIGVKEISESSESVLSRFILSVIALMLIIYGLWGVFSIGLIENFWWRTLLPLILGYGLAMIVMLVDPKTRERLLDFLGILRK